MADLSITVEDNQLMIRGKQTDDAERVYLHRGIAARQFQRSFVLAEGIEVRGAWLDNGLLHIDLVRPPVEARVRTVPIRGPEGVEPGGNGGSAALAAFRAGVCGQAVRAAISRRLPHRRRLLRRCCCSSSGRFLCCGG